MAVKIRDRGRLRAGKKPLRGPFICQNPFCGKDFYTVVHHKASPPIYCSRACVSVLREVIATAVRAARHSLARDARRRRAEIREARRAEVRERWATARPCRICTRPFIPEYKKKAGTNYFVGLAIKHCPDCRSIDDRIERFGVAHEAVNPYTVFRRDKWTCQHCGYVTPKWLRGLGAEGPTLDHILPVAKGGAHSYANTQCLCSECNSKKRDRIELEPRLVGVTDFTRFMVAAVTARIERDPKALTAVGGRQSHRSNTRGSSVHSSFARSGMSARDYVRLRLYGSSAVIPSAAHVIACVAQS